MEPTNKSICMMPWVNVYQTPDGHTSACCVCNPSSTELPQTDYKTKSNNLMDLVNTPFLNQLRLDMIAGKRSPACSICYDVEEFATSSWRTNSFDQFENDVPIIDLTNSDGSINKEDFKLRYFDIRNSNLCNYKCRSCNEGFSSQWEVENKKHNVGEVIPHLIINGSDLLSNKDGNLLEMVRDQIKNIKVAYFAGGEPMMNEMHYMILEEFIKQGRTDINLIYATNLSQLGLKHYDILDMWSKFDKKPDICGSIDHIKERAEYIRTGTNWGTVEHNIVKLQKLGYVLTFTSVISVYNWLTYDTVVDYFKNNMHSDISKMGLIKCHEPAYLSARILPEDLKQQGVNVFKSLKEKINPEQCDEVIDWVLAEDWSMDIDQFETFSGYTDYVRDDNFVKTFPELRRLVNV